MFKGTGRSQAVRVVIGMLLVVAVARTAFPQITAATISGLVKDDTGAVLPGATIVVKNSGTGSVRTVVTNDRGLFTVPGLAPGHYETTATLQGFTSATRALDLAVAQEAALNMTLAVGGTSEHIDVVATAQLVDTRSAALSAVVTKDTIEQLPLNGRNYIDLALLQPGVTSFNEKNSSTSSNRGTKLNINGMGYRSNSYLIDGANMRGFAGTATVSAAETTLGVETIQEFRVVTNAYSADYGRSMGGIISIVTKSGTNALHGSGFEFFRDSKLDKRNFFDPGDPPPFRRNQFGGSFGGPVVHNRLFFFGGVERLQEDLGTTQITTVPTAAVRTGALGPVSPVVKPYLDLYPLPNSREVGNGIAEYRYEFNNPTRETFYQIRGDYAMSEKDSVFARYTWDGADQTIPVGFPDYRTDSVSRNQFFTVEHKRIMSSSLLNTARFSHSRLRFEQLPDFPSASKLAFITGEDQMGVISVSGLTAIGGTTTNPSTNNAFYWTMSDDLSYAKGRHLLKAGVLVEHERTNKLVATNTRGSFTFPSLQRFLAASPTRFVGVLPGAELERVRPNTLFGVYVQDDLRASDRVTLNLGLRYEFWTMPTDRNGMDTKLVDIAGDATFTAGPPPFAENPSLKNVAPRVGFAWDVTGDGRTSVRGGAGLYHDTDGVYNSAFGVAAFSPPFGAQATLTNPAFPVPSLAGGRVSASARTIDYHIRQPYAATYNANVQHQLPGDLVVTLGYAGSQGYNLVSAIEGNPFIPVVQADGTKYFPPTAARRNPNFTAIDYRTSGGRSRYNALQASLQKRFSRAYQAQLTYALAKVTDNTQAQLGADANNSSVYPQDPYNRDADIARADFDVRHVVTANFVWELPGRGNPLVNGWQLNGILTFRSGVPFTVSLDENWSRTGNTSGEDRPNVKAGRTASDIITGDPRQFFDPTAFELQPAGYLGNEPRNFLTGARYANLNLALVKNSGLGALGAGGHLQLRLEVFNVLNTANFATPIRSVFAGGSATDKPLANAGRVTKTVTPSRQLQAGVKLSF